MGCTHSKALPVAEQRLPNKTNSSSNDHKPFKEGGSDGTHPESDSINHTKREEPAASASPISSTVLVGEVAMVAAGGGGGGGAASTANNSSNLVVGGGTLLQSAQSVSEERAARVDWKVRPGYSSGASSCAGSEHGDSSAGEGGLGGLGGGGRDGDINISRHSEILSLSTLRKEIVTDGDLASTVVRIETPFGKPIDEIYDGVHDGPVLGSGVSGIVRLVKHRATAVQYAVKCLDIGLIDSTEGLRQLRDEIFIMCQLDHPNIVRIEEVYESTNDIYIVQELCVGGDLFDRLDEQPDYHYTEAQCARLVKQMMSGVRYLHSKGIIHRDLKLENFLFSSAAADSELKMIDFGLSKHFVLGQHHHEKVGTPYTVAPEIIRGAYDEKSDIWALGVITYLLFSGETPFGGLDGENLLDVKNNIMRGQLLFEPADIWENVSADGRAFVTRLLNCDPAKRPTAKEAQRDSWVQVWSKKKDADGNKLNPRLVGALMSFKEYSDMQKLLSEVLSFTLLPEQIVELRGEFEKIDTDGSGEISLSTLKHVLLQNAEAGSLGALTEQEIDDIFDAIRIRKSEPTIRWHEFLAAGLSQARVDDRNLRLAFDRLDTDRKGYITLADLRDVLGSSTESRALEQIWVDSLKTCQCGADSFGYDDFKRLMKGQHKQQQQQQQETAAAAATAASTAAELLKCSAASLVGGVVVGGVGASGAGSTMESVSTSLDVVHEGRRSVPEEKSMSLASAPASSSATAAAAAVSEAFDYVKQYQKKRSKSMEQINRCWEVSSLSLALGSGDADYSNVIGGAATSNEATATMMVPNNGGGGGNHSCSPSPLVANRALYRKHRGMRLAVLEASKSFDKKRNDRLSKEEGGLNHASLIMRRGATTPIDLEDAHTRALFDAAAKRCGRARRTRNKTVSDVTGMLLTAGK